MKNSLEKKLKHLAQRQQALNEKLGDLEVIQNPALLKQYSKEYAALQPIVESYQQYAALNQEIIEAQALLEQGDDDIRALAKEELLQLDTKQAACLDTLKALLLPEDPNDHRNVYLEIRAGTGGEEASLFVSALQQMYQAYADSKRWQLEVIHTSLSKQGGYKEIISRITGKQVYSQLKFESGTHRVQRVPITESQGRIHTSACTVAILPEVDDIESVEINPSDLRIDTYRSSGAGGQHVNTTDSAVRITHLPSGTVAECQDERSQHKNRAKAMKLLQARILVSEQEKQQREQAQTRRNLIGSGDRSERIRTYNFPQGRITDHRINLTLYKIDDILQGQLDHLIQPLTQEHQADQLADMENDAR